MKSITKAIALVLALLMVAGLAACGGETNTKAPQNAGPKANTAAENAAQLREIAAAAATLRTLKFFFITKYSLISF